MVCFLYLNSDEHNMSPGWSNYKYRRRVDGGSINNKLRSFRFPGQRTGAVDNLRKNSGNWSCGVIPNDNTDVRTIDGFIVLQNNSAIRSLQLSHRYRSHLIQKPYGQLCINGNILFLAGIVINNLSQVYAGRRPLSYFLSRRLLYSGRSIMVSIECYVQATIGKYFEDAIRFMEESDQMWVN